MKWQQTGGNRLLTLEMLANIIEQTANISMMTANIPESTANISMTTANILERMADKVVSSCEYHLVRFV